MTITHQIPLDITMDSDPQQLFFAGKGASEYDITLTNNDTRNAASLLINACRADLLNKGDLTLTDEEKNGGGYKLIDEKWVECRLTALDAWQAIDDWATPFDLGPLAAGADVSFQIRVNVPTANTDSGRVAFALMVSSKPADQPQVTSVTIDQDDFSITEGNTDTATATVVADVGADDSVVWTSSNTAAATINVSTGVITAVAAGTAIITAMANDNNRIKSSRMAVISAA
jgi:uncharacterized protein YjdB